jgi:hypothetical protein
MYPVPVNASEELGSTPVKKNVPDRDGPAQ